MIERITPFAHSKIKECINTDDIVVDMTVGNGNDTVFLAPLCKHVYAFDIQYKAIETAKSLVESKGFTNVSIILDNHVNARNHISDKIRCVVFNLGYLPSNDKHITTTGETTVQAINNILPLMSVNSLISITLYPGHIEGYKESIILNDYVSTLPSSKYNVLLYKNLNVNKAPYNIFIEKIGE